MNPFGRKKTKTSQNIDKKKTQQIVQTPSETPAAQTKKLPAFFEQFSEKQINLIYSVANIQRLEPQVFLFKEGQTSPFLSIILEGQLNLTSSKLSIPLSFGPGTILGAKEYYENTPFKSAAFAASEAVVMLLEKNGIGMLDQDTKDNLNAAIIKMYAARAEGLEINDSKNAIKISSLAKSLYKAKTAHVHDYGKSELIFNIIKKIPKLPAYTHTLSTKLLDEDASSKEIVALIRQDPALVADVLKSVNSSYYGLEQKVSDINSAVLLLGFQSLYQLIMSEGIRKSMPDTPNFRQIHTHALALSYIAFSLSMTTKIGIPVQLSTIGMLHNMGETIVSLLLQRNPNLSVFISSLDHPSLGAFLLEEWNFPKSISQTVRYQHFPEFAEPSVIPPEILDHVAVLHVSRICYSFMKGALPNDLPLVYFDEYKQILKLDKLSVEEITRKHVISDLKKKQDTLPVSLKSVISSSNT